MRTEHLGPDELLVCAKVEFVHELTVVEVAEAVDRVERNVRGQRRPRPGSSTSSPTCTDEHRCRPAASPSTRAASTRDDPLWAEITGQRPAAVGHRSGRAREPTDHARPAA